MKIKVEAEGKFIGVHFKGGCMQRISHLLQCSPKTPTLAEHEGFSLLSLHLDQITDLPKSTTNKMLH